MKIELRNVKYAAFASQETSCFAADVWIDGAKAGTVDNEGHGGPDLIHPPALHQRLAAYCKTLPEQDCSRLYNDGEKHTLPMSPDLLIGDLLNAWLVERDVKRKLKRHILYTKPGDTGIWQSKGYPAEAIERFLKDPQLPEKLKADKVLNLLPLPDAIAAYRAGAT